MPPLLENRGSAADALYSYVCAISEYSNHDQSLLIEMQFSISNLILTYSAEVLYSFTCMYVDV